MNEAAQRENMLALERLIGISHDEASSVLTASALITHADDETSRAVAAYVSALLSRTLTRVREEFNGSSPAVEIVIGHVTPRTSTAVFLLARPQAVLISRTPIPFLGTPVLLPASFALLGSCYLAGFAINYLLGERAPVGNQAEITIDFRSLFGDESSLDQEIDIGTTYLAGAGAVGNGFLLGLATFPRLKGNLLIADHDSVSAGNLNRCLWFGPEDIGKNKAEVLSKKARTRFHDLVIEHRPCKLGDVPEKTSGAWLERLVVAVDSRPARRSLQSEMPGEVFDASTTGVEEIVFHHHKQPTDDACLGCIYYHDTGEDQRARHIADVLGVSMDDVAKIDIDTSSAAKIKTKYPELTSRDLVGIPFDSFFKEMCGEGKLMVGGEQVVAPLSFVSVMAGTYLAIEFVRRMAGQEPPFNYARFNPWKEFVLQTRRVHPSSRHCGTCTNPGTVAFRRRLWG